MKLLKMQKVLLLCFLAVTGQVSAGEIVISHSFATDGNDCSGYFGSGIDNCSIWIDDGGTQIQISPLISKFNTDGSGWEISGAPFASTIDGSEWSGDLTGTAGTWSYNPGSTDPGIRYWAAKNGQGFELFWTIDDSATTCVAGSNFSLSCLNEALIVDSGTWATAGGKNLSHLSFYDSDPAVCAPGSIDCGVIEPNEIPEPTILLLFAMGVGGLGLRKSRG